MTNIEVGARLKAITSLVTMSTVIDVGSDHGKAAAELPQDPGHHGIS